MTERAKARVSTKTIKNTSEPCRNEKLKPKHEDALRFVGKEKKTFPLPDCALCYHHHVEVATVHLQGTLGRSRVSYCESSGVYRMIRGLFLSISFEVVRCCRHSNTFQILWVEFSDFAVCTNTAGRSFQAELQVLCLTQSLNHIIEITYDGF